MSLTNEHARNDQVYCVEQWFPTEIDFEGYIYKCRLYLQGYIYKCFLPI